MTRDSGPGPGPRGSGYHFTLMIPPRAVLAAVSFSDASRAALVLAARLARHCGAELHVLHVEDPLLDVAARHEGIDLVTTTYLELQRFVAGAWPAADCLSHTHVVAGAAVEVILAVARRHQVDLVVVSSAEKRVFGSVTGELLRRTDVSVLVAPAQWTPPHSDAADLSDVGPLVVVVDPSDPKSISATKAACELATVLGASIEVVHFVQDQEVSEPAGARANLELWIRELGCSAPVEVRFERGAAADRLAEVPGVAGRRAPMVVLGKTASRAGWPGAILNRVLSGGTVPILMYVADQIAGL